MNYPNKRSTNQPTVVVIGAGMSGILMGIRLQEAGYSNYIILEKGDSVGGTWRENTYPGLHCDVPSVSYSYSFEPNENWSKLMSSGPEIHSYFQGIANKYGVDQRIQFNTEVDKAVYGEDGWHITTKQGEEIQADFLITATGILHHPVLPDIKGRDSFKGQAFHSARWNHSTDWSGKKVGIIGTGSTAVQIAEEVCKSAGKLTIFQRTPQWIFPSPQRTFSGAEKFMMKNVPGYMAIQRKFWDWTLDLFATAVTKDGWQRRFVSLMVKQNLRTVKDPELRKKLTPDYEPLCKRLIISDTFYDTVQRANVDVQTEGIQGIEAGGVRLTDESLVELDILIYATGFDTQAYLRPIDMTGLNGKTLENYWSNGPRAYRTIAMPGFPNMFMLQGPHSPIGNFSTIATAEAQTKYIIQCMDMYRSGELQTIMPSEKATLQYERQLKGAMGDTVWVSGCNSWYISKDGTALSWPWDRAQFNRWMEVPELSHFDITIPQDSGIPAGV